MNKNKLARQQLVSQLKSLIELDHSLGIEYYHLSKEFSKLEFEPSMRENSPDLPMPIEQTNNNSKIITRKLGSTVNENPNAAAISSPQNIPDFHNQNILSGNSQKISEINKLFDNIRECKLCTLFQNCKQTVCSQGNVDAEIAFIAGTPGREEDIAGLPFQGTAGKLITDIIEKGMQMPRNSLYLSTIIKCRPQGNREPFLDEIETCKKYINKEIQIINPKIIIAVGQRAVNILTGENCSIEQTRGIWYKFNNIPLMPIYDPSFLLRQRRKLGHTNEFIRQTWNDIKQVLKKLKQI